MKTIKMMMAITIVLVIFSLAGCGAGGKYGEVKKLMTDYLAMTNKLDKALSSGNDGKAVAVALNEYIAQMKNLSPQLESLPEKFPELEKNPPAELAELISQFEASADSFKNIFSKIMNYSSDPNVMDALKKMEEL